jgi:hypothetical protein
MTNVANIDQRQSIATDRGVIELRKYDKVCRHDLIFIIVALQSQSCAPNKFLLILINCLLTY